MISKLVLFFLFIKLAASGFDDEFIFDGSLPDGASAPNGFKLTLTNTSARQIGHVFYTMPLQFKNSSKGSAYSFSTTFIFQIIPEYPKLGGHGIAFVLSPSKSMRWALPSQDLGLFNSTNVGDPSNHIAAVELDTVQDFQFGDIDENHVGIHINDLTSSISHEAGYFTNDKSEFVRLNLKNGEPMQAWVEYNGVNNQLNVTLFPINVPKPKRPLISSTIDLSPVLLQYMYIGLSAPTGLLAGSQSLLGWSFKMNGQAQALNLSHVTSLIHKRQGRKKGNLLKIGLPLLFGLTLVFGIIFLFSRKKGSAEILEDWELEYGPHRFSYKDLVMATSGFRETRLLGKGGFGRVYKGVLPTTKTEVAVKKVCHESKQGMKEFVAEIVSLGRLRHRNLVQLLGYCRVKGELLLVYEFMPHGSLDKFIFAQPKTMLNWGQRFRIIKGIASGLLYLHEDWEKVVLHRDIKASNVLLDKQLNARLGDFGLARLYDHETDPRTTHVAGTLGYLAPELSRTGKATTSTDVYAFGAFMLEVACGRRPVMPQASPEEVVLVDWVLGCWNSGKILEASDPNLGTDYVLEEMELVLKLGLLCSHPVSTARPSMRQVMQFLDGDASLPELLLNSMYTSVLSIGHGRGFENVGISFTSSVKASGNLSTIAESVLSGGR